MIVECISVISENDIYNAASSLTYMAIPCMRAACVLFWACRCCICPVEGVPEGAAKNWVVFETCRAVAISWAPHSIRKLACSESWEETILAGSFKRLAAVMESDDFITNYNSNYTSFLLLYPFRFILWQASASTSKIWIIIQCNSWTMERIASWKLLFISPKFCAEFDFVRPACSVTMTLCVCVLFWKMQDRNTAGRAGLQCVLT